MGHPPKAIVYGSIHSIAHTLLKKSGKPMSVRDITNVVLKHKPLNGKTPQNTVNAILQRSEHFKKVGWGSYAIKSNSNSSVMIKIPK